MTEQFLFMVKVTERYMHLAPGRHPLQVDIVPDAVMNKADQHYFIDLLTPSLHDISCTLNRLNRT